MKQVLFTQGGGERGYEVDKKLVASLKVKLGNEYHIIYSEIRSDLAAPDFGWTKEIGRKISDMKGKLILVGHSFGASMILKFLSEHQPMKNISGIFLISTPFWSGDEEWKKGLKLNEDFADKLPIGPPIFFYHCKDDEEVPFSQFEEYKQKIPFGIFREIKTGGHQLNNDLSLVAKDMKSL
ncbi:MAG: alpha/beta hydrolase [Ginsengibacter sp.]